MCISNCAPTTVTMSPTATGGRFLPTMVTYLSFHAAVRALAFSLVRLFAANPITLTTLITNHPWPPGFATWPDSVPLNPTASGGMVLTMSAPSAKPGPTSHGRREPRSPMMTPPAITAAASSFVAFRITPPS